MATSKVFGGKRPIRPQYATRNEGVAGEIADLRRDADEAFFALEQLIAGVDPSSVVDVQLERVGKILFTWETPIYQVLQEVAAGQVVSGVAVLIQTPFEDPAAVMQLGTSSFPTLFFGPDDAELATAGQYTSEQYFVLPNNDTFVMTLNPGTSTQGAGYLIYRVR